MLGWYLGPLFYLDSSCSSFTAVLPSFFYSSVGAYRGQRVCLWCSEWGWTCQCWYYRIKQRSERYLLYIFVWQNKEWSCELTTNGCYTSIIFNWLLWWTIQSLILMEFMIVKTAHFGAYWRLLTPGTYQITASAPGFISQEQKVKITSVTIHFL